jgi:hypothetical protein
MDIAHARKIVIYVGVASIIVGLLLIVAQVIWHERFDGLVKQLSGGAGGAWGLQTNVVGFGVLVVGAILLVATIVNVPKIPVGESRDNHTK